MKKLFLILIIIQLFKLGNGQNFKLKAILIYNFTKFITWDDEKQETFDIGILGNNDIVKELKIISKNYTVLGKPIKIHVFNSTDSIIECNFLYITKEKVEAIDSICNKKNNDNTILISTLPNADGKCISINFVILEGKQRFEIYQNNINNKKVKLNSKLLKIGIIK